MTCDLLLRLSHARPACELRRAAVSALRHSGERRIRASIQGQVERVGEPKPEPSFCFQVRRYPYFQPGNDIFGHKLGKLTFL